MSEQEHLPVTIPFLPPFEGFVERLKGIWERNWLTNQGPLLREFEERLGQHLGLPDAPCCVANGALGLQIALRALGVRGEVITTPFSYAATSSCPLWEGCSLVFADIEPDFLTIDPALVDAAVTPRTEAILATHVFGNPCDVEALEAIGRKHGLKVIYDAAHAFGVEYKDRGILDYGDASMVSLHATKLMHCAEGGFVVAGEPEVRSRVEWMRRFGHATPESFQGVGINGKLSELHAAMGLCCLDNLDELVGGRRRIVDCYDQGMAAAPGLRFAFRIREGTRWNDSYYPVLCESAERRAALASRLEARGFQTRRYFYPSLDEVYSEQVPGPRMPVSRDVADRILCLPLASQMEVSAAERIAEICSSRD